MIGANHRPGSPFSYISMLDVLVLNFQRSTSRKRSTATGVNMPRVDNNKDTLVTTKFPWNTLGAETLRAVIRDLGVNSKTIRPPQKGVYVQFLQTVSDKGCESRFCLVLLRSS
jgi:hypothetical protein